MADDQNALVPQPDRSVRSQVVVTEHVATHQTEYGECVVVLAREGDGYMTADALIDAIAARVVTLLQESRAVGA